MPGTTGVPARDGRLPRRRLRAHDADRFRRGSDEDDSRGFARGGEIGVLAQKSVARMNGLGAVRLRRVENAVDAQIAFGRCGRPDVRGFVGHTHMERSAIGIRVDGDARDPHLAQRANDAHRNLAAIGDQDLAEHEAEL